jgi:hypothetical protein
MATKNSQEQPSISSSRPEDLSRAERCPVCGGDNQCRVAKGHLYKGACWCAEINVPSRIFSALSADCLEPTCICRSCLETLAQLSDEMGDPADIVSKIKKTLENSRLAAHEEDCYLDENENVVFTAEYHLRRGTCCGNGCRHCPF